MRKWTDTQMLCNLIRVKNIYGWNLNSSAEAWRLLLSPSIRMCFQKLEIMIFTVILVWSHNSKSNISISERHLFHFRTPLSYRMTANFKHDWIFKEWLMSYMEVSIKHLFFIIFFNLIVILILIPRYSLWWSGKMFLFLK